MIRNLMMLSLVLPLAMVACKGDDKDTDTDTDTDTNECTNAIGTQFPAANASNVYYRSTVEFTFTTAEDDATMTVTEQGGSAVAGSTEWIGNTLVFTPDAPFAAATTYEVSVDYSCGTTTAITWTTSEVGSAVTPGDITGATYALDLASGRFVEPPGVGAVISSLLSGVAFTVLIGVDNATATDVGFLGALSAEGSNPPTQDLCTESIVFPVDASFSENPFFIIESDNLPLEVQGVTINIADLTLSGAFAPDGSYIAGAVLAGSIDTRPLVPLVEEGGADDAVCSLVSAFNVACEACPGDNQPFCLSIYVDSLQAAEVSGLTLEARTAEDIAADGNCTAL